MSGSGDDKASVVDITSNIGTWVGAAVAIIALVGIVGPFLAIQASMSNRNRAMNAVQDKPQKYVTTGFRLNKGLRVFRRIRVPNLSHGYIANDPNIVPLIPLRASTGRWVLRPGDYYQWNTGWAKLAEVIEAYNVHDGRDNHLVDLGISTDGALEVVNHRTALAVNKHWILLLGLLGRYGSREDKGILQNSSTRREFEGERASIRQLGFERKPPTKRIRPEPRLPFGLSEENESQTSGFKTDISDSYKEDYDESPKRTAPQKDVGHLRRSAYGEWTIETKSELTIYGVTGVMRSLGRHLGSWSYLTSISFKPHTIREILPAGILEKRESASVQTLFWLAHGFLPCGRTPDGRQTVICLESPVAGAILPDRLLHRRDRSRSQTVFVLQESNDISISIGHAIKYLGIPEPKILQFLPLESSKEKHLQEEQFSSDEKMDLDLEDDEEDYGPKRRREAKIKVKGNWVDYINKREGFGTRFPKREVERLLAALLGLEWDSWGFIIWKDTFWEPLLRESTGILGSVLLRKPEMGSILGIGSSDQALRWRVCSDFHQRKLADYLSLEQSLNELFDGTEVLSLRMALGTLFVIDTSFQRAVKMACKRYAAGESDEEYSEPEMEHLKIVTERGLQQLEDEYWVKAAAENPNDSSKESGSRNQYVREEDGYSESGIRTHLILDSIDSETLMKLKMEPQFRTPGLDVGYIDRYVPQWELDLLSKHSAKLRELRLLKARLNNHRAKLGPLEYNYASKELKWYSDGKKSRSKVWRLNGELVRAPASDKTVEITQIEAIRVALWAANRAALWLSSQDSEPLLKFIDELDPYTYVL